MGQLGPIAALVYQALWVSADDYGTARADPEQLKGDMFTWWPGVSCADIAQGLRSLAQSGRIACYRIGDETYARVVKWDEHQKVHMPGKFRYPTGGVELSPDVVGVPCADPVQPCADTASPLLHYSTTPALQYYNSIAACGCSSTLSRIGCDARTQRQRQGFQGVPGHARARGDTGQDPSAGTARGVPHRTGRLRVRLLGSPPWSPPGTAGSEPGATDSAAAH